MNERQRRRDRHDMKEHERKANLLVRRVQAFENRSRKGGDGPTWAVVLGAFIGVMLLASFSIGGETRYILYPLAALFAWWFVVSWKGGVNITSILWGSDTSDQTLPPNEFWIYQPTALLALFAIVCLVRNVIGDYTYSWAGLLLMLAVVAYAIVYARVGILRSA